MLKGTSIFKYKKSSFHPFDVGFLHDVVFFSCVCCYCCCCCGSPPSPYHRHKGAFFNRSLCQHLIPAPPSPVLLSMCTCFLLSRVGPGGLPFCINRFARSVSLKMDDQKINKCLLVCMWARVCFLRVRLLFIQYAAIPTRKRTPDASYITTTVHFHYSFLRLALLDV